MDPYVIAGGIAGYLLACACAGSYCSSEKGRSPLEGFILGALFGPAGIIAAACLPLIERRPIEQEEEDEAPEEDVEAMLSRIKKSAR
jgi:hypothetical protein